MRGTGPALGSELTPNPHTGSPTMPSKIRGTRRTFLKKSAAATAGFTIIPSYLVTGARGQDGKLPPSYKLVNNLKRRWDWIQAAAAARMSKGMKEPYEWEHPTIHDLRRTYGTMLARHVPLHELERPDVPQLRAIPESDRPVITVPLLGTHIHAPTAAILYQLREVVAAARVQHIQSVIDGLLHTDQERAGTNLEHRHATRL